jgi:hypothetical protein
MTRLPDFHEEMDRLQKHIPSSVGHNLNRLRGKRAIWMRVLTGVALVGAWCFFPLPIVGFWMLPVGLALLAHDIPMIRRPMARLLHFANRQIEKRKCENTPKADVGHSLTKSPKTKNHAADDDCTNKRPDNYFRPPAGASLVDNKVASSAAKHSANYGRDL